MLIIPPLAVNVIPFQQSSLMLVASLHLHEISVECGAFPAELTTLILSHVGLVGIVSSNTAEVSLACVAFFDSTPLARTSTVFV